jgi:DNA replication protein DnaC
MKILQVDKETFRIFGDSLDIKDKLPINTYVVDFNPMGGFSLVVRKDFKVTEKIYGNVEERINKVIRGYQNYNRSLGVIFSGNKGIGKSLASQLLCQKMLDLGYPVILVNNTNNGIIDFFVKV